MKAQELRIGNWIRGTLSGIEYKLDTETFGEYLRNEVDGIPEFDYLEGIPLTEEWLLKFGFDKKPLYGWNGNSADWQPDTSRTEIQDFVLGRFTVRFEKWGYLSKEDGEWKFDNSVKIVLGEWYEKCSEIEFYLRSNEVHCLQNVYFEMEAKELTITV